MSQIDRNKSNLKVKKVTKKKKKQNSISRQRRQKQKFICAGSNIVFGIDNGSTGTVSCIIPYNNYVSFIQTPSRECLDYTKQIQYISRIDYNVFKQWFKNNLKKGNKIYKQQLKPIVILQRPMVNPQRFKQSGHALRAFQATILLLEQLELQYIIIDSKKWQHHFFGKNTSQLDLKKQSLQLGIKIIQQICNNSQQKNEGCEEMKQCIRKHGDADGLLICKYGAQKLI